MKEIKLKRGKEESLLRRHPWIFSGAIHSGSEVEEGDIVDIVDSKGEFLARGICAVGSISVRVLSFEREEFDVEWWAARIESALSVRRAMGLVDSSATNCYRLIHGEGDNLSGLVVDVYGGVAVMQAHAVGIYLMRETIAAALVRVVGVTSVYDKSSGTIPYQSGVEVIDGYLIGDGKDVGRIVENGIELQSAWEGGQKTGFFIDQRDNRELLRHYSRGRRVLNTFCYTGGFSLAAIKGGAISVDSVDSSAKAIELCSENIACNFASFTEHREIVADALGYVRNMEENQYDLIVLDPPAFAKHRGALDNALQAYKRLNAAAISRASSGTILFTFSCSQAVSREQFRRAVFSGAAIAGRSVRILHFMSQPADHPINIYHPEGEYLKGLVLYVE
ncbi:MAG: class I SAM-dependent rRNA methyltransferase [Rikenellaceae bacterium]